jgi:histidinol dehydrogenase
MARTTTATIRIVDARDSRAVRRIVAPATPDDPAFERRVRTIVDAVRSGGDKALVRFARRFDGLREGLEVSAAEMRRAADSVDASVRRAIEQAATHIARVAFRQIPRHWDLDVAPGVSVEQRVEPLARVGCYVPAGRFPLPSSLLMTAVPARVAGVREVFVACPRPDPVVMAAALEAGVTRLFRIGGAHAIAALAFGTATVPRVDKIVGPGNRYVATAKSFVAGRCGIDFYAGPTEIVIVAGDGDPTWIAADLIAQAEHDPDARSMFITWNRTFAQRVAAATSRAAKGRPIVLQSLAAHGAILLTESSDAAMALANALAPEHLVLENERLGRHSITAGSVFIGAHTAQAAGDYAIGSNHVLPTAGAARFRGGLSASDFMRVMSVQRMTREGLAAIAPAAIALARAEGLTAHAESIEIRLKDDNRRGR